MDRKLEQLLIGVERVIMHVEHGMPPEETVILEVKKLIGEVRQEHGITSPVDKPLPGTA